MNTRRYLPLALGALLLGACMDLTVPDYNNPSLEELRDNPTRAGVLTAATGLLIGARDNIATQNGYVSLLGVVGRESFVLDPADPRYVTELIRGPLDPGSPAFGGNLFSVRYRNIRNANIVLGAVGKVKELSEAEKEAIRGFAKTIKALDYLLVINTRGENGAPIAVDQDINADPAPIESQEKVFAHIAQLLDEAQGHLRAGGSRFPFPLSAGFTGFDTPVSFLEFNRALRAVVAVYAKNYPTALAALQESFVSTEAPLSRGVYFSYGVGSGETSNLLSAPTIYVQPLLVAKAERKPNGELDDRVRRKVKAVPERTLGEVSSGFKFTLYEGPTAPVPIVRNEELILLRAEALWFTGRKEEAIRDLNFIRTTSGGLAPIAVPSSDAAFVDRLLYERRYSLLFEGGHRWIDHRRFDRLDELPKIVEGAVIPKAFPIPVGETDARK